MGAHLEQVTARFAANLACLATVRASLSWFGISFPLTVPESPSTYQTSP